MRVDSATSAPPSRHQPRHVVRSVRDGDAERVADPFGESLESKKSTAAAAPLQCAGVAAPVHTQASARVSPACA
jgi:hypothetical protein